MPDPGLHILDLPVDVLTLILRPLLTSPILTTTAPTATAPGSHGTGMIPLCACAACPVDALPILLTHPAIYAIACPLFYGGANRFMLDLRVRHAGHVRQCLREAAEEEAEEEAKTGRRAPRGDGNKKMARMVTTRLGGRFLLLSMEARRRVQRLDVEMDRLRGWVEGELLGPLVGDMILHGRLSDLQITVHGIHAEDGARRKGSKAKENIFSRPPMRGLLELLADPDLRNARLRVRGTHRGEWCPFHAEGGRCGSSSMGGEEGREEVLEIDWRAILREVDPEGRGRAAACV